MRVPHTDQTACSQKTVVVNGVGRKMNPRPDEIEAEQQNTAGTEASGDEQKDASSDKNAEKSAV